MKASKDKLIDKVKEKGGYSTKKEAEQALRSVSDSVSELLQSDYDVQVPSVGSFKWAHRQARAARNPATGEQINVPAKRVVKFKAAKELV